MIISMIVAHGPELEIGLDNKMLWHIKDDFKHFKATTMGHHMIMGRKTFDSIGRPLPGRTTIVLTRGEFEHPDVLVAKSLDEALELARQNGETEVFIAGGANVYEQFLPRAAKLYLSKVQYKGDADTFFPKIDESQWTMLSEKHYPQSESSSLPWTLVLLERKES